MATPYSRCLLDPGGSSVEGSAGIGRHLAQRLIADGEAVVDVPAKLSARVRVFSTGQGRKTDATDAHSVALVAARTPDLAAVTEDGEVAALRLLADRHDELAAHRVQTVTRLHRLLLELVPGGAPVFLSALQAKALLATVFAEFEVDLLRLRTKEGMAVARAKGKLRGRQPKLSAKQQHELRKMHGTGEYTVADLAEVFSVARATVYRTLRRQTAAQRH